MKNYQLILSFLYVTTINFVSCDNISNKENQSQLIDKKDLQETLIEANIEFLAQESNAIDNYVTNNNLNVIKTGTGLRYQIFSPGDGDFVKKGDLITIDYKLESLKGDLIYSSENDGFKSFVVGRGGVESGLEEAVLKMKKNSEAIFILPSHLAHGYVGDGDRITYRTVLVYKVKVIDIK